MKLKHSFLFLVLLIFSLLFPFLASAHEVYVLDANEINNALSMTSPNPFSIVPSHQLQFLYWGLIVALVVVVALRFSFFGFLQKICNNFLVRIKKYAPLAGRLTLGVSLFASGYFHAFFGPELAIPHMIGGLDQCLAILLIVLGSLIFVGLFTRIATFIALAVFALAVVLFRGYMLTYLNYFGEIVLVLALGGDVLSLDRAFGLEFNFFKPVVLVFEKYSFLVLRVCFGIAVFFASFYAKFLHSNLALDTVADYHLTNYFHFTPLFLVLGAFIIEALLGLFFATGFEVRLAAIFFTVFLTISLIFFGEVVWPHLILFGVNIAIFMHGYDQFTLEKFIFRKNKLEPIL